jgi:hypothetical protein
VPAEVKGTVKVVGLLEGWPFKVQEDPTEFNAKAMTKAGGILQLFEKAVKK